MARRARAAVQWRGGRLLFVEGSVVPAELRAAAARWDMARIVAMPALPLDKRHHAKLDYPALRELLEQEPAAG